jgi:hypothetical protein
MALWVLLFLALVLVKANRTGRAWLILIPVLIVMLVWSLFKKAVPIPSSQMGPFDQLIVSLAIGISIVFLLGHKIGNRHRLATFLLAMLIMVLVCTAGLVSFGGLTSQNGAIFAIMSLIMAAVMLLAFVMSGFKCRKQYGPVRFMLWLAIWTIGCMIVAMFLYCAIAMIAMGMPVPLLEILMQLTLVGLMVGGILYAVVLPFMILVFKSGFFRERFFACLRLRSMQVTADAAEPVVRTGEFADPDDTDLP